MEDKLQSLQSKVSNLDVSNDESRPSKNNYTQYIYVLIIFCVLLTVLIWWKPSFLTYRDEKENKVYLNKTKLGGATAVLTGAIVGGWYWYAKR